MNKTVIYLNLTNGIEALYLSDIRDPRFLRIQSTACEQKRWDFILQDLDYDFLMSLALGNHVVVYDYSRRKKVSRAIWQGLKWVEYVLNRIWFDRHITVVLERNSMDVTKYFDEQYNKISERTKVKLKYFRKFLMTERLNLDFVTGTTLHDSDNGFYRRVLERSKMRVDIK